MSAKTMSAMVFGAGFGKRMAPLTNTCPKPLLKVGGQPMLDRALGLVDEANAHPVAVNTHYLGDQIKSHLHGRDIHVLSEMPDILDTGGGLKAALPVLGDDPLFTFNPDCIWIGPNPLHMLRAAWEPSHMRALLMVVPIAQTRGRNGIGDFSLNADATLSRSGDLLYTGAQILDPSGLAQISERSFSLNTYWNILAGEGGIHGLVYPGFWCDIGHPEGIKIAEAMLDEHADV